MQDFKDAGVDVTGLVADSTLSTVGVFAFVDDRGERYLWGWPRERRSFKVLDENLVPMHMIREADWVHSSGVMPDLRHQRQGDDHPHLRTGPRCPEVPEHLST